MKLFIHLALIFLLAAGCGNETKKTPNANDIPNNTGAQTFEIWDKDTVNSTDYKRRKQGKWIILGIHKTKTCFNPGQVVEEGTYKDDKKTGVWKEYYCSNTARGTLKNTMTYVDGILLGEAKTYYENGKPDKEGTFKEGVWVGEFKKYNEEGQLQYHCIFNEKGERDSVIFEAKAKPAGNKTGQNANSKKF